MGECCKFQDLYSLHRRLLNVVKELQCNGIVTSVRTEEFCDWFPFFVGESQGCVISPWLFSVNRF